MGRFHREILALFAFGSLVGCVEMEPPSRDPRGTLVFSRDQRAVEEANDVREEVRKRAQQIDRKCQGEGAVSIAGMIETMALQRQQAARDTRSYTDHQIASLTASSRQIGLVAADSYLIVGDAYLKARCLNQADTQYRHVLATYPGASYVGVRQRAQVGIEDVRAARGRR